MRYWHKPQNSTVCSLGQHSSKFSLSSTVQAHSAASPQTCCILSSKCRTFTFSLLLVTTTLKCYCASVYTGEHNTPLCTAPVASPRTSKSCILCTTLWSTFFCQQEKTLQGNTVLGTKLEEKSQRAEVGLK